MTILDLPSLTLALHEYLANSEITPLFITGDAQDVLRSFPDHSIDCCITSPPYWGKRYYDTPGIGNESTLTEYINHLLAVCIEVRRVLKPSGSFWLNLGDTYHQKSLAGIPWRVALRLMDEQGWLLRNDVIWHKVKGGLDTTRDRLRNVHEYFFHFVKTANGYYYDIDAIRHRPRSAKIVDGAVVSATGVRGVRYRRQIELSTALNEQEKEQALRELERMLQQLQNGAISDFRMIIRGQQRPTHSDSTRVSGRARELQERGFYFLVYHPQGSKPGDVWDILPEDTQARHPHFAPYPTDICRIPILATCPPSGIVLDPFCGTGTTMLVAQELDRKSIGIDISPTYIQLAEERCRRLL
ncbi:MAG: site-specific DNA-methyltransferase [Chloroflexus sp.]|nr:site-specific DNA-methyltransferase [Chloroflexus sp.]